MSDMAVFWIMVAIVWVLWIVAVRLRERRRRVESAWWVERYGPRREGPPRVVP